MLKFESNIAADEEELVNLTSMVDVVFILLSFFVLTTRFVGEERELAVGEASEQSAPGLAAEDLPVAVRVQLRPSDVGVAIRLGQVDLPVDAFGEITARLEAMEVGELPVVIAAHESLPVASVARAIEAVLNSPNQQVSLAVLEDEPGGGVAGE